MIRLKVNCLKFGQLGLKSAPYDAFEVIHFKDGTKGIAVARIEVDKSDFPELRMRLLEPPRELTAVPGSVATMDNAVLGKWSDEVSTHFSLTASGAGDDMEVVLAGQRKRHSFWWRSHFRIVDGQVIVQAPSLANDPDS